MEILERKLCYPEKNNASKALFLNDFKNSFYENELVSIDSVFKGNDKFHVFFIREFNGVFNPVEAIDKININKEIFKILDKKDIFYHYIFSNRIEHFYIKIIKDKRSYKPITINELSLLLKNFGKEKTIKPLNIASSKIEYDLSRNYLNNGIYCFGGDIDDVLIIENKIVACLEYKTGTKNIDIELESHKRFEQDKFKYLKLKETAKNLFNVEVINLIFNDNHFNIKIEFLSQDISFVIKETSYKNLAKKTKEIILNNIR